MPTLLLSLFALVLLAACADGDGASAGGASQSLRSAAAERVLAELDCPLGPVGEIRVVFGCDSIDVYSCKELSNVVLELEGGEHVRFEGLSGHAATFSGTGARAGQRIARAWVKAGANFSFDGPGYGDRFEPGDDACSAPGAGTGGGAGNGGEPVPCAGDPACSVD